jgi:hypothetical protein
MAFIVRDNEIVPIAIPVGKRVKIGSHYNPPLENYVANDQLWIQDIYTFNQIPWYAIKNRFEKWMLYAILWCSTFYMLTLIGRFLMKG